MKKLLRHTMMVSDYLYDYLYFINFELLTRCLIHHTSYLNIINYQLNQITAITVKARCWCSI